MRRLEKCPHCGYFVRRNRDRRPRKGFAEWVALRVSTSWLGENYESHASTGAVEGVLGCPKCRKVFVTVDAVQQ